MIINARKIVLSLFFVGLLAACDKIDKKARIAEMNEAVFCIAIYHKDKNFEKKVSVGTGFLVGDGLLASAFHVQTKS